MAQFDWNQVGLTEAAAIIDYQAALARHASEGIDLGVTGEYEFTNLTWAVQWLDHPNRPAGDNTDKATALVMRAFDRDITPLAAVQLVREALARRDDLGSAVSGYVLRVNQIVRMEAIDDTHYALLVGNRAITGHVLWSTAIDAQGQFKGDLIQRVKDGNEGFILALSALVDEWSQRANERRAHD